MYDYKNELKHLSSENPDGLHKALLTVSLRAMRLCADAGTVRMDKLMTAAFEGGVSDDPPGMVVWLDALAGDDVWWWGDEDRNYGPQEREEADARAAAWVYYWRRAALAARVDAESVVLVEHGCGVMSNHRASCSRCRTATRISSSRGRGRARRSRPGSSSGSAT